MRFLGCNGMIDTGLDDGSRGVSICIRVSLSVLSSEDLLILNHKQRLFVQ